jgi:hypothetical protein
LIRSRQHEDAIQVFVSLRKRTTPTADAYLLLLKSCQTFGDLDTALRIVKDMKGLGLQLDGSSVRLITQIAVSHEQLDSSSLLQLVGESAVSSYVLDGINQSLDGTALPSIVAKNALSLLETFSYEHNAARLTVMKLKVGFRY